MKPELENASKTVAEASSLDPDEIKELNRLLDKIITAFSESK